MSPRRSMAPRFSCASLHLSLRHVLGKGRRVLGASLGCALVIHLCMARIQGVRGQQAAARPLTTQFIKRQPRLTKPLELKKRPQPKRRRLQREMVSVKARAGQQQGRGGIRPAGMIRGLARPRLQLAREVGPAAFDAEPKMTAGEILSEKKTKGTVDMPLEMVDLAALDTGKYHAMVVEDPSDKRSVRGFFHLAFVYSVSMKKSNGNFHNRTHRAVNCLVEAMNKYTDIQTDLAGSYSFDSAELFNTPWIHVNPYSKFRFTESEARNLGKYLVSGGFASVDRGTTLWGRPEWHWQYFTMHNGLKEALATQGYLYGRNWTYVLLPNDHSIYHCYFDFDGPPAGYYDYIFPMPYQDGIFIESRLVAICQYIQRYYATWAGESVWRGSNGRQLQFAINTIIFALTQEGSITNRLMDSVAY